MLTLNNTNIFLLVAVIVMIILILYTGESYKSNNIMIPEYTFPFPTTRDTQNTPNIEMDNSDYKLGDYYFSTFSPQYNVYNAYKSDPSQQPITLPSVDYDNEFESTLSKKCNSMYVIPESGSMYINLLNASKNY